jgi:hypothetical protein
MAMNTSTLDTTKQSELDKWLQDNSAYDLAKDTYTDKAGLYDHMSKGAKWTDTLLNGTSSKKLTDSAGNTLWDPASTEYSNAWDSANTTSTDSTGATTASTGTDSTGGTSSAITYNSDDKHPEYNTGDPLYDGTETIHDSRGNTSTKSMLSQAFQTNPDAIGETMYNDYYGTMGKGAGQ